MYSLQLTLIVFTITILSEYLTFGNEKCEMVFEIQTNRFNKIKNCFRSNLTVIASYDAEDVKHCKDLASQKGGTAFNYSPEETNNFKNGDNFYAANCEVLDCPEYTNSSTLVSDPFYDYYSLYGDLNSVINTTCITSFGVFRVFNERENYTRAITKCQNITGDLVDIISESRTNSIASLLARELRTVFKVAYVGMDNLKSKTLFETSMGDFLNCHKFRAWGPGHPRFKKGQHVCVTIDSESMWRTVNCSVKLPFVCELYPIGVPIDVTPKNTTCSEFDDDYEDCPSDKKGSTTKPPNKKINKEIYKRCTEDYK